MDDLTAADYRLLLSLMDNAIVAPDQRSRVEAALKSGRVRVEIAQQRRNDHDFVFGDTTAIPGLCPAGGERN